MDRRNFITHTAALALTSSSVLQAVAGEPVLEVRARVGPWPVISRLIAYNGRLWFANSVKWRNHNSADIWSFDPTQGEVRYERHLFSQDAGVPLVHHGLLYWPFEDSRFSNGWGMIDVTDGRQWQPLLIPTAEIFHTSSLINWKDQIVAITSAWRTGFQISDDLGRRWRKFYDHSTPKGRLSRFRDQSVMHNQLYGQLEDPKGVRLVKFVENRPIQVPGWPENQRFFAFTKHMSQMFAVLQGADGHQIWQTNGRTSELVSKHSTQFRLVDLASDGIKIWAISREKNGGQLWSSPDGVDWAEHTRFSGGQPLSLDVIAGKIYVAGAGNDGRGIIWGPAAHHIPRIASPEALPVQFPVSHEKIDWPQAGARLDAVLGDISQYQDHGRKILRTMIFDAVRYGAPPDFFSQRLKIPLPEGVTQAFGGKLDVTAADMGQSYLFWGMGLAKHKSIPLSHIKRPWHAPANSFEKYFDPQLTAIWAIMVSGQKDAATISSLIEKLDTPGDPLWLRGQVTGTLSALTGKKLGHDDAKWIRWWISAKSTWDEQVSRVRTR